MSVHIDPPEHDPTDTLIKQAETIGEHGARLDVLETAKTTTEDALKDVKETTDSLDDRIRDIARDTYATLGTAPVDTGAIVAQVKEELMAEAAAAKTAEEEEAARVAALATPPPAAPKTEDNPAPKKNLWDHLKRLI